MTEVKAPKEVEEIFPNYNEFITLKEGDGTCGENHEERFVHHQFYTKKTSRGKEWYEIWVCPGCNDLAGKLVNITEKE